MEWTELLARATASASLSGCSLDGLVCACLAIVFRPSEHA